MGIAGIVTSLINPLSACSDEPDNYYMLGGEETESSCYIVCEHLFTCDPKKGHTAEECVVTCKEYDLPSIAPEWVDCIMNSACTEKLRYTCEKYLPTKLK